MAFAPHTNQDVQYLLQQGLVPTAKPLILGGFTEAEYGHRFEYAERRWFSDEIAPEMPHIIYVGQGETRLARVLKTVAYVLTTDEHGEAVTQKWAIKQHNEYETAWVRA